MVKYFVSDDLTAQDRAMPVCSGSLCQAALVPEHRRRSGPQLHGDCSESRQCARAERTPTMESGDLTSSPRFPITQLGPWQVS